MKIYTIFLYFSNYLHSIFGTFMKLRDLKIGTRLLAAFWLILILISTSFYLIFDRLNELAGMTEKLYRHPFTVTNSIREIKSGSEEIRKLLYQIVIFPEHIDSIHKLIDSLDLSIYRNIELAKERYLGDKNEIEVMKRTYMALADSRDRIIDLVESGDLENARKLINRRSHLVDESANAIRRVLTFSTEKSREFYDSALQVKTESITMIYITMIVLLFLSGLTGFYITRTVKKSVVSLLSGVRRIGNGEYGIRIELGTKDELGNLAEEINNVSGSLKNYSTVVKATDWVKSGLNELGGITREEIDILALSGKISAFMAEYLDAGIAALYVVDDAGTSLELAGGYGLPGESQIRKNIMIDQGLAGECVRTGKVLVVDDLPGEYFNISSGTGSTSPVSVVLAPLMSKNRVMGVLEMGFKSPVSNQTRDFIEVCSEPVGISIEAAKSRHDLEVMLKKTRELAEELKVQQEELKESNSLLETQQEELRAANEELEEQSAALKISEEKLKSQQEELEVINEELEEKNESLQRQKADLVTAREELEIKAEELEIASKYKSEFLANMSHELRTPLNSLLILSQMLAENKEKRLSGEEVESAQVIHKSGSDLLNLINEILDLSKIEAGKMDLHIDRLSIAQLHKNLEPLFRQGVSNKGLELEFVIEEGSPAEIETDRLRLEQILKNLISNAVKFTAFGKITVKTGCPDPAVNLFRSGLKNRECIAISVSDTGIGIPAEKQKIIFEAFQQADGSTSRIYGGTGLGLSISRELAHILGGEIQLSSREGAGSTFTLYLPLKLEKVKPGSESPVRNIRKRAVIERSTAETVEKASIAPTEPRVATDTQVSVHDDRDETAQGDKVVLIVEDDPVFAKLLYKECKERDLKGIVALTGTEGLKLASQFLPMAILLDLELPDINGLDILSILKDTSATRHIPVHIVSASNSTRTALQKGAIGFLTKPVAKEDIEEVISRLQDFSNKKVKDILLIEDDDSLRFSISRLINDSDVQIITVTTGKEAIHSLENNRYDLVILDLGLPDMTGFELLHYMDEHELSLPPVIVYTGKELTREEDEELRNYAESIIIKGVRSEERLIDETALFLHRLVNKMPEQKRKMIIDLHETDVIFRDKKILIVDDDMRNVFALSKLLSEKGMKILKAENGEKALEIIESEKGIDLILMDIMMPVMDGYETTRRIRQKEEFYQIPIIAVTAKAMKKDYEECIAAGASDYLPKPVDIERLFSLMRVWLYR